MKQVVVARRIPLEVLVDDERFEEGDDEDEDGVHVAMPARSIRGGYELQNVPAIASGASGSANSRDIQPHCFHLQATFHAYSTSLQQCQANKQSRLTQAASG